MTTVAPNHYRTSISYRTPQTYIDQKMYRTILDNRQQQQRHANNANSKSSNNPFARASMSSLHQQQQATPPALNSQMFSVMYSSDNQKYITNNSHNKSLATHV
jgi:hypothetical protein